MSISRRQFMVGCSSAIAAMADGRVANLFFDDATVAAAAGNDEILVVVFLRGGCDGLSLVAPYDDAIYRAKRGELALQNPITLNVNNPGFNTTSNFGLHPLAAPLNGLYQAGKLAIVHACGLDDDTRSHFDAMDYMERGTPGNKGTSTGWLARHLAAITTDDTSLLPTVAASSNAPASLLGDPRAVAMNNPRSYSLSGHWRYTANDDPRFKDAMLKTLEKCYTGSDLLQTTGKRTIETIKALRSVPEYTPGATYPPGGFGDSLKSVAQMIKLDIGLRAATVDLGGWDHHESQGVNDTWGPFYRLADTLARGMEAFYNDLPNHQNRVTLVVMSEFGRRLGVNASNGTDHGHGNVMLVLGGKINGGKLYGQWPGLVELDQSQDLKITSDYRTVVSEILVRRLRNPKLGMVFPGLTTYTPLGLTGSTADDLPIDFNPGGL